MVLLFYESGIAWCGRVANDSHWLTRLQVLLAIRQLKGPHSGENQAQIIISVIKDYGLEDNIGYFVTDNATNNDTAIDAVLSKLCPHLTKKQKKARRLRCLGHVINLSAKAFLYGKEVEEFIISAELSKATSDTQKELELWRKRGPISKLHNLIIFICRTPQRREAFESVLKADSTAFTEYNHLKLVIDNATRWNSLYSMIERALNLREKLTRFVESNENELHGSKKKAGQNYTIEERKYLLKHDKLDGDDWKVLKETMVILKPFYTYTKRAEGKDTSSDRGVLSDYIVTLNTLLDHVRTLRQALPARVEAIQLSPTSVEHLQTALLNCWVKLDEYFTKVDATPAHYAAIATRPQSKFKYFERAWKHCTTWPDATTPELWIPTAKEAILDLWKADYATLPLPPIKSTIPTKRPRAETDAPPPPSPDRISTAINCLNNTDDKDIFADEMDKWLQTPRFDLPTNTSLPQYWVSQLQNPQLYRVGKMALDMCSVPAMSAECERVFSSSKLMITGQRMRLKADIIEAT